MGGKRKSAPAQVNPLDTARAQWQAQLESVPQIQQATYQAKANPEYGDLALTRLQESIRQQLYPEQYGVQQQYTGNVMNQLQNPYGMTPEQSSAQDRIRGRAQTDLQRALNNQANLGNKLYGGINFDRVGQQSQQLQDTFANEDINNNFRYQQAAYQNALPILQAYLGQQIQTPGVNYGAAAPDANAAYSGSVNQRNADLQYQMQQEANQAALYSALFSGGGTALGGWMGGGMRLKS